MGFPFQADQNHRNVGHDGPDNISRAIRYINHYNNGKQNQQKQFCSRIKMEADIEAFSISIFHLHNSRLFKVLPYNGLTNKRTDYSAHKAEQNNDWICSGSYERKQSIGKRSIKSAFNQTLLIRICREDERKITCTNPKIEYAAADNGFFPAFIFPGLGNQICNHSCRNTNRCAKKAHTKDKQQNCNNNRCYCKHPKLLDPRIVEHHRNTSDNRDENCITGDNKRG